MRRAGLIIRIIWPNLHISFSALKILKEINGRKAASYLFATRLKIIFYQD